MKKTHRKNSRQALKNGTITASAFFLLLMGAADILPRYFAYYPARFTPQLAYALVSAQNRGGVKDFILSRFTRLAAQAFHRRKRKYLSEK